MTRTTHPTPTRRDRPARPWRALGAALLLTLAAAQVQAQWVWRDKDGRVNASDRPPPREVADKDIVSRPPDARRAAAAAAAPASAAASAAVGNGALAPASAPRGTQDRELEARRRAAEQEQAARAKAEEDRQAALRAENCRRARSHVAALESGQRIARLNDKGEREVLDDRGRADELRQARSTIAADCR